MRVKTAMILMAGYSVAGMLCAPATAVAQRNAAAAMTMPATDVSAQARRRPRVKIYRQIDERGVYPSYFPGSNAVRDCTATYVQEFRPSGTVIVPRMNCFWRQP